MKNRITIIDYEMGNICSVLNALTYLGYSASVSSDCREILDSNILILPGVGSFRRAMMTLCQTGLDQAIVEAVIDKGSKILGICLGMQLLAESSTEDGKTRGLGLIPANVERFKQDDLNGLKVPHIGFNQVTSESDSILFKDLPSQVDFYFVHSYRILPAGLPGKVAHCCHGETFLAAYEWDNVFATQFHPEKSQTNGLKLLKNFLLEVSPKK